MGRKNRKAKEVKEVSDDEEIEENEEGSKPWTATGYLESTLSSRDIKIGKFSVTLHGQVLVNDTTLELNYGCRYGLIGLNGSGKSTMLKVIGERQIPIPEHFDIYYLAGEVEASEQSALDCVLQDLDKEVARLEHEEEELAGGEGDDDDGTLADRLNEIYERLEELDVQTAPTRAGRILHGLGFTKEMQHKKTKDFSGGWRMRIALARALFVSPNLLLLDEPTNHLDLEACVWLEEYLKTYHRILIVISHSQDFLNNVCTNIVHLQKQILTYYSGNYDTYIEVRSQVEENQMKQYNKQQEEIQNIKNFVAKYGHGSAKLARQAKSREKILVKMGEKGLIEAVHVDKVLKINFEPVETIPPPVLAFHQVSFGYKPGKENFLYRNVDFAVDLDSRIALVGPNGAGKSTLLKLMVGEIQPTEGMVKAHHHLKIARYHQHLQDQLDVTLSPLEFMLKEWPEYRTKPEQMRQQLGRFGITGKTQALAIDSLSDGQKSRVVLSWLSFQYPHILLLDEPTNHLDLETIDSLASAINSWNGGMVLVSHDFRLISQVATDIWECKNQSVVKWPGNIMAYKTKLRQTVLADLEN